MTRIDKLQDKTRRGRTLKEVILNPNELSVERRTAAGKRGRWKKDGG